MLHFLLGVLASVAAAILFDWLRRPNLTIVPGSPDDKEYVANHPIARKARFLNVRVEYHESWPWLWLSRAPSLTCVANVNFLHLDDPQRDFFGRAMPGRWSGWPEPLAYVGRIGDQHMELVNPYFMSAQFRRTDIYSGDPVSLDIAVRFDDDLECYGWTTENYNKEWKNEDWRLPAGRYRVSVTVRPAAARSKTEHFLLVNDTAIGNFRLEPARPVGFAGSRAFR